MEIERSGVDDQILEASTEDLFAFLKEVDPEQAARFHPSDRRKIRGKVELYLHTGRSASELYKEEKQAGVNLRWDTLIFWVWSDRDVLNERLDKRVDTMITHGLEDECRELHRLAEQTGRTPTTGIFQAIGSIPQKTDIGYREFIPVFTASEDKKESLRTEAIQRMKSHTRQYVNTQLSWISNKLLPQCALLGNRAPVYILDASDPTKWQSNVLDPALLVAKGSSFENTH
jgi:tRNA dimethylallyltransferase